MAQHVINIIFNVGGTTPNRASSSARIPQALGFVSILPHVCEGCLRVRCNYEYPAYQAFCLVSIVESGFVVLFGGSTYTPFFCSRSGKLLI